VNQSDRVALRLECVKIVTQLISSGILKVPEGTRTIDKVMEHSLGLEKKILSVGKPDDPNYEQPTGFDPSLPVRRPVGPGRNG
jgi:hypothetical protein